MLQVKDEEKILSVWEEMIQGLKISPEVMALHKKVLSNKDFLTVMKTDQLEMKIKKNYAKNSTCGTSIVLRIIFMSVRNCRICLV